MYIFTKWGNGESPIGGQQKSVKFKKLHSKAHHSHYPSHSTVKMTEATVDDYDFTKGDAGASHVYNNEAGQVRVGG